MSPLRVPGLLSLERDTGLEPANPGTVHPARKATHRRATTTVDESRRQSLVIQWRDRHRFVNGIRKWCVQCQRSCRGNGNWRCPCCNELFGMGEMILGRKPL